MQDSNLVVRAKLDALIDSFVALWTGLRQRSPGWYAKMGTTVGGSELAAVLGVNPYMSFMEVVSNKVAALASHGEDTGWDGGSVACWWGVLFEPVVARVLEIDCGTRVKGDKICIQAIDGHRNSPDGYCVLGLSGDSPGDDPDETPCYPPVGARVHTTDLAHPPTALVIALLEFKCPHRRKPDGKVPKYYRPQVLSGLAVSPVAMMGLFVDAVFRKCALWNLGGGKGYDWDYHRERAVWEGAVAWGLTAVHAPLLDAPLAKRIARGSRTPTNGPDGHYEEPEDVSLAAWELAAKYLGSSLAAEEIVVERRGMIDFGECSAQLFDRALGYINRGLFPVSHTEPCFADGRGFQRLSQPGGIGATLESLRAAAPPDYYLLGVIPWKLMEVDYVPVEREPGFLEKVRPKIEEVHRLAREAISSGTPDTFLREAALQRRLADPPTGRKEGDRQELAQVNEKDLEDFFARIT